MIFVEKVILQEIERDSIIISTYNPKTFQTLLIDDVGKPTDETIEVKEECIKGDIYHTPDGRDIVIGISEQARNALGIPIDAWKKMKELNKDLTNALYITRIDKDKLKKLYQDFLLMSFWCRLKFLFTGSI